MSAQIFSGWIDKADPDIICGWAANTTSPDRPVNLAFHINGARVAVAACADLRPDAVAAGYPGARQFAMSLKPWLKPGQNLIEVNFESSGQSLPNGRQLISIGHNNETGDHWSGQYSKKSTLVTRWWESDYIIRRINRRVCGESLPGMTSGLHQLALQRFAGQVPFEHGVSIGCGTGLKERSVIRSGLVDHFTLFELSSVGIERGRKEAAEAGLADKMNFRMEDGLLAETREGVYDVVYWNNALHHMFDVKAALEWSWRVLRKGGVLLMDDFVGPTRMQWSDRLLAINTSMRKALPPEYLRNPWQPNQMLPTTVGRHSVETIMAGDPSECADSVNILPELTRIFPDAWVQKTGGGIYHLGLSDVLHNIIAAENYEMLEKILEFDDECAAIGETHYAVAIAVK
jgi:SAM-dependent methyltransferase